MPLLPGKSNIGANIKEMESAGHPRNQSVAAALRKAYGPQKRADGGHVGALRGDTPGRADKVDTTVEDGAYIIPARVVSFLGDGNSGAGFAKLERMFPHSVAHRAWGGAMGTSITGLPRQPNPMHMPGMPHMPGISTPHITPLRLPHLAGMGMRKPPIPHMTMSEGGKAPQIKVALSDGEFAVSRQDCLDYGKGDIERGHKKLDAFVIDCDKKAVKHIKSTPGPVGSQVQKPKL